MNTSKHNNHSRRISFMCAESIAQKWPNLHLEGYDIDEAAKVLSVLIPPCILESQEMIEQMSEPVYLPRVSLIKQLRDVLNVPKNENMSIRSVLELAISRLKGRREKD